MSNLFCIRLLNHDIMSIHVEVAKEFLMDLPDAAKYRDIHAGAHGTLPPMTKPRLQDYLRAYSKKLDDKIQYLYRERY